MEKFTTKKSKSGNQSRSPSPIELNYILTDKSKSETMARGPMGKTSSKSLWDSPRELLVVFVLFGLGLVLIEWIMRLQSKTQLLAEQNEKLYEQLQKYIAGAMRENEGIDKGAATCNSLYESIPDSVVESSAQTNHIYSIVVHGGLFFMIMSLIMYHARKEISVLINIFISRANTIDNTDFSGSKESEGGIASRGQIMSRFTANEYFFYRMDWFLSNHSYAKPVSLLVATYMLIFSGGMTYFIFSGSESFTLGESMWVIWTFVADPGTHADETTTSSRVIAFFVTLGGMLIFALVIGIIADGVSDLLDDLKKGKSRVIESGHTLILGWSDKTLPTIVELCIANESEGGGVIVVLADRSKEEMENELKLHLSHEDFLGTVVVCRSGSPILMSDLVKVSAQTAKSVIVLSDPEVGADESDAHSVRVVMSLTGIQVNCHMVVEMCDIDNRELVLLVGKGMVETVVSHDIIGRLMIQCARQPGLAQILEQILGFEGDEFYIKEWPSLVGKTFGEVCYLFETAIPIGVKPADPAKAALFCEQYEGSLLCYEEEEAETNHFGFGSGALDDHAESGTPRSASRDGLRDRSRSNPGSVSPTSLMQSGRLKTRLSDSRGNASIILNKAGAGNTDATKCNPTLRSRNRSLSSIGSVFGNGPRTTILNPPNCYLIEEGDEIIVLAEDDDTYEPSTGFPSEAAYQAFVNCNSQRSIQIPEGPEKMLFCGWRRDIDDMIVELDKIVEAGSELTLMSTIPVETRLEIFSECAKLDVENLQNLQLKHQVGNQVIRRHLECLELEKFDSILILADEALETNMQTADSRSLASLLLIRDIIQKSLHADSPNGEPESTGGASASINSIGNRVKKEIVHDGNDVYESKDGCRNSIRVSPPRILRLDSDSSLSSSDDEWREYFKTINKSPKGDISASRKAPNALLQKHGDKQNNFSNKNFVGPLSPSEIDDGMGPVIISEILDSRTKSLISVAQVSDYVMSNEIVASAMAMVSEDRSVNRILSELLSSSGNEIITRSCLHYCRDGEMLSFWEIITRARDFGQVAIGYKSGAEEKATLNPQNKDSIRPWVKGDLIIVLSKE